MTINNPQVKRRDLLKAGVAASAAMTVGIPLSEVARAAIQSSEGEIVWTKGVCRFCGTGCGLQVGVKDGRVVATKGDPDAPVNRGLNCIKGYFNAKILYGKDRLTQPLMRRTNGCSPQQSLTCRRFANSIIIHRSVRASPGGLAICCQPCVRRSALP